ncbi:MAG: hypothetical protein ABJD53_04080 [Gammaproteobacteria bacterium]
MTDYLTRHGSRRIARNIMLAPTTPPMKAWMATLITQITVPVAIACNQALKTTDFRAEMKAMETPIKVLPTVRCTPTPIVCTRIS